VPFDTVLFPLTYVWGLASTFRCCLFPFPVRPNGLWLFWASPRPAYMIRHEWRLGPNSDRNDGSARLGQKAALRQPSAVTAVRQDLYPIFWLFGQPLCSALCFLGQQICRPVLGPHALSVGLRANYLRLHNELRCTRSGLSQRYQQNLLLFIMLLRHQRRDPLTWIARTARYIYSLCRQMRGANLQPGSSQVHLKP
jgi:hypothetical protein